MKATEPSAALSYKVNTAHDETFNQSLIRHHPREFHEKAEDAAIHPQACQVQEMASTVP
jgi:hypothetical protein